MSAAAEVLDKDTEQEYRCPCGVGRVLASVRDLVEKRDLWEGVRCRGCGRLALLFVLIDDWRGRVELN